MQREIDFSRAEQLGILRDSVFDKCPGISVVSLKAFLRALDDFCRGGQGWPSQKTIAEVTGMSCRQVKRAVQVLEEASVICVTRQRQSSDGGSVTRNHYKIVWTELALLTPKCRTRNFGSLDQSAAQGTLVALTKVPFEQTKVPPEVDQSAARGTQKRTEAQETPSPLPPRPIRAEPDRQPEGDGDGWKSLPADLRKAGLNDPVTAIEAARANGAQPAEVRSILEHWWTHKPSWEAGALYHRIRTAQPGEPAGDRWPDISAEARLINRQAIRAAKINDQLARRKADAEDLEESQRRSEALERDFGPALDARPEEDVIELLKRHGPFVVRQYRAGGGRASHLIREYLLIDLESLEAVK